MSIGLYEHNRTAYNAALKMLLNEGRAAVIHPTGTGKSFIGFKLCEDNKNKRICWLSPSEYIFKTQLENVKKCAPSFNGDNIIFITYAKLMLMNEQGIKQIKPDYIILDEFHRAGAQQWGAGVKRFLGMYNKIPVLGLSATNIRYLDNQRDMALELFGGNIASEMTLGEAIVKGILTPPKYVLSVFQYQNEYKKYQKKINKLKGKALKNKAQNYLDALKRALDKADGLDDIFFKYIKQKNSKYIVFCANVEHMHEMKEKACEWFNKIDSHPHIYCAYSDNPESSKAFNDFKCDTTNHLKLLFCIDMLNEGIHVDDVNGVILLRPTVSPIIYKQQIGRALCASSKSEAVIFDIVLNFENLQSINDINNEMQEVIAYNRDMGKTDKIVNTSFNIIDEVRDCRKIFDELNNVLCSSWDIMFDYAKDYYNKNGDLNVPKRYKTEEGYSLGNWIFTQRRVYNGEINGNLTLERINKLNSIKMIWQSQSDESWNRFYAEAEMYFDKFKNLDVNINYVTPGGVKLGRWIAAIRGYRKSGRYKKYLTQERITALDKLNMIWDVPDYLWHRNYVSAVKYYTEHGNLEIEDGYVTEDGIRLDAWVRSLRRTKQSLTPQQIASLEKIGMKWEDKYSRQWNDAYSEAKKYFEANNNLDVPVSYITPSGFRLGRWIARQRDNSSLSDERRKKLNDIQMIWKKHVKIVKTVAFRKEKKDV